MSEVKYLGVVLYHKLNFNCHISYIIHKVDKTTKILYSLVSRNASLIMHNKKLIIKTLLYSFVFYSAPVWSSIAYRHMNNLHIAQKKLFKMICSLSWQFSSLNLHSISPFGLLCDKILRLSVYFRRVYRNLPQTLTSMNNNYCKCFLFSSVTLNTILLW